jgi:hypothetical protein
MPQNEILPLISKTQRAAVKNLKFNRILPTPNTLKKEKGRENGILRPT